MQNDLSKLLESAREQIADPRAGLPVEAFYFVSELTPLINVDLLIRNKAGQTLLTWRADEFYGPAWHVPGGIIRFKEKIEDRIRKVALSELGCEVRFSPQPIQMLELMHPSRNVRGHFISLLYLCELITQPDAGKKFTVGQAKAGEWAWHAGAPSDLLYAQEPLRRFIDDTTGL